MDSCTADAPRGVVEAVLRAMVVLLVMLVPVAAWAQSSLDAGSDLDAAQAEVDRDYAAALASDCGTACVALDSMRRATEHLCALDPGERCAVARRKLVEVTARVVAACPSCTAAFKEEDRGRPVPPPPPAPNEATTQMESVSKKGGCAGCATASTPEDAIAPVGLGALALVLVRARRRRR